MFIIYGREAENNFEGERHFFKHGIFMASMAPIMGPYNLNKWDIHCHFETLYDKLLPLSVGSLASFKF